MKKKIKQKKKKRKIYRKRKKLTKIKNRRIKSKKKTRKSKKSKKRAKKSKLKIKKSAKSSIISLKKIKIPQFEDQRKKLKKLSFQKIINFMLQPIFKAYEDFR